MIYSSCHDYEEYVTLTSWEFQTACLVGRWMYEKSQADGRSDAHGFEGDGERIQMLGSLAERAAAKALDVHWPAGIDQGDLSDLPHNIEVRALSRDWYGLRVRDSDLDDRRVVAVIIPEGLERLGPYRLPGWITAEQAKRTDWVISPNGRPPMFAVPQDHLYPIAELRRLCAREVLDL